MEKSLNGKRVCVGDMEGNGLLDTITKIHCCVLKDIETKEVFVFGPNDMYKMMNFMTNETCELIFHNGIGFDFPAFVKVLNYHYPHKITDTLIMSKVMNPNRPIPFNCPNKRAPHSVEVWGYRVGRGKVEHHDWENFSPEMLHRCKEDVEIQFIIYQELMKEAEQYGGWFDKPYRPMDMTHRLFTVLQEQEEYGWLFDREYANTCISSLSNIIDTIAIKLAPRLPLKIFKNESKGKTTEAAFGKPLEELGYVNIDYSGCYTFVRSPFLKSGKLNNHVTKWLEETGHKPRIVGPFSRFISRPIDIESPDELKGLLLSLGWEPKEWNTNDNGENTSPKLSKDDPFEGLKGGLGKMIAKRIQCKHRRSQIEGWIRMVRPDGRISSIVTGLATTGRAKHAQIVNVPGGETFFGSNMRKCFICKPGYKLVGTDSAGCQNRMLAARVNDEFFTHTLLEGKKSDKTSIHYVNQRAIKEVAGIDVTYHDAKTLNYGALFGASPRKLAKTAGCTIETGELIQKAIFGVAPGFQSLIDNLKAEWKRNAKRRINKWGKIEYYDGWVRGLDGRPIFIEAEHTLLVYMLQSDESICMSAAYCKLYSDATKAFGPHGDKWGFVIWMHDEYQAEVREDIAEDFARLAEEAIKWAGNFYHIKCEQKGESDIGVNWAETH